MQRRSPYSYTPLKAKSIPNIWYLIKSGNNQAETLFKFTCLGYILNYNKREKTKNRFISYPPHQLFLCFADNKAPFINTIKKVHDKAGSVYNVKAACLDFLGSLGLVLNTPAYEK